MAPVVNTATNVKYPFECGTEQEKTLFRVTPTTGSSNKMYFDSKEQYIAWRQASIKTDQALRDLHLHIIPGLAAKGPLVESI